MSLMNQSSRYGSVSQFLHWTTVVLVFVQLAMGKAGVFDVEHPASAAFMWHGSLGVLILVLVVVRILWLVFSRPPALPAHMSRGGRVSAKTVHVLLYALLIALPLSGWWAASSERVSVNFFDIATLPRWDAPAAVQQPPVVHSRLQAEPEGNGEQAEDFAEAVHEVLGDVLIVLITLHILAALKHQFIDRDRLIQRMLPAARSQSTHAGDTAPLRR